MTHSTWLRRALVIVGLAAAVYGVSSLTGGWLGTPWWGESTPLLAPSSERIFELPREGREAISVAVILLGVGLAAMGLRPHRATSVLVVIGLVTAVYGIASLTGGWLGKPPWWTVGAVEEVPSPEAHLVHFSSYNIGRVPRAHREWISGAVVVAGLGIAAIGMWARRRRPDPGI